MRFLIDTVLANKVWDKKVDSQKFKPRDSTIRLLAVGIFDLGQIEKTVTIFFFQLNIEIEYKTQINNLAIHLMS